MWIIDGVRKGKGQYWNEEGKYYFVFGLVVCGKDKLYYDGKGDQLYCDRSLQNGIGVGKEMIVG